MILNILNLHNFMSYADANLDLTGIDVACLSGRNGAGKSALLDAITWCLWQNGRASSDELIKLGEKEMWVDLTFTHAGHHYRVRRSRHRSSGRSGNRAISKGNLDFQIFSQDQEASLVAASSHPAEAGENTSQMDQSVSAERFHKGTWRSLTSGTGQETQAAICHLLRMDFDTFTNSVYLRQGKADQFTTRLPSERKQVLGEILGLSYFDKMQERAREKTKELRYQMELLTTALAAKGEIAQKHFDAQQVLLAASTNLLSLHEKLASLMRESDFVQSTIREAEIGEQRRRSNLNQIDGLTADVGQLQEQRDSLNEKLVQAQSLLCQQREIRHAAARFEELKLELEQLDQRALQFQRLMLSKTESQTELARIRSQLESQLTAVSKSLEEKEKRIDKLRQDTADGETLEGAHREYKELVQLESAMADKQEDYSRLSSRAAELDAIINETRIYLQAECGQKELLAADLERLISSDSSLTARQQELQLKVALLDQAEIEFDLVEQKGMDLKLKAETNEAKILDLKRLIAENKQKVEELQRQKNSSFCPLCSAPIVDRAAVVQCYERASEEYSSQISSLRHEICQLEVERTQLRKRYSQLRHLLEGRQQLDVQIGHLNEKLSTLARARDNLQATQDEIVGLQNRLSNHDFAHLERESLVAIKAESYKLDFDAIVYSSVQAQLRAKRGIDGRYAQYLRDQAELERLMSELPALSQNKRELCDQLEAESYGDQPRAMLKAVQQQILDLNYERQHHEAAKKELAQLLPDSERIRDLQQILQEEPSWRQSAEACRQSIESKQERIRVMIADNDAIDKQIEMMVELKESLLERQQLAANFSAQRDEQMKTAAVAASTFERLAAELADLEEKAAQLVECKRACDDYTLLADAFGKKGIQAVIIENAIPEIETEANKILSRLSENQMHIGLRTQYKTKSGSVNETLDLMIGDEVGTRNYELFSGGEAFKINFAVRVALSKLLARRSGARLETLIIDEGFGSQDEPSRERLAKAIRAIQCDFARILVITHMADIKEMFPIQIHVQKVNGSSRLKVVI